MTNKLYRYHGPLCLLDVAAGEITLIADRLYELEQADMSSLTAPLIAQGRLIAGQARIGEVPIPAKLVAAPVSDTADRTLLDETLVQMQEVSVPDKTKKSARQPEQTSAAINPQLARNTQPASKEA